MLGGCPKFNYLFLALFIVLQVIVESGLSELVLVMKGDPYCLIYYFYGECESWFLETIGAELLKERWDVDNGKLYEAG